MIDNLHKQQATWRLKVRCCKADDRVTGQFVGSVDGEEFEW